MIRCIAQHLIARVFPFVKSSIVTDFAQSIVLSEQVVIYLFFLGVCALG